jgi:hypothetical protein
VAPHGQSLGDAGQHARCPVTVGDRAGSLARGGLTSALNLTDAVFQTSATTGARAQWRLAGAWRCAMRKPGEAGCGGAAAGMAWCRALGGRAALALLAAAPGAGHAAVLTTGRARNA